MSRECKRGYVRGVSLCGYVKGVSLCGLGMVFLGGLGVGVVVRIVFLGGVLGVDRRLLGLYGHGLY